MKLTIGRNVEVKGDPDEGFNEAWNSATIVKVTKRSAVIKYADLIVDDGSNVVEEIARNRLRPALKDDSAEVPLERRQIGAAVDCWARDCWWEGYIHSAHKDRVTVRFRESDEEYVVYPLEKGIIAKGEESPYRLRTSKEWDNVLERWKDKQPTLLPCLEDHRQQEQALAEPAGKDVKHNTSLYLSADLYLSQQSGEVGSESQRGCAESSKAKVSEPKAEEAPPQNSDGQRRDQQAKGKGSESPCRTTSNIEEPKVLNSAPGKRKGKERPILTTMNKKKSAACDSAKQGSISNCPSPQNRSKLLGGKQAGRSEPRKPAQHSAPQAPAAKTSADQQPPAKALEGTASPAVALAKEEADSSKAVEPPRSKAVKVAITHLGRPQLTIQGTAKQTYGQLLGSIGLHKKERSDQFARSELALAQLHHSSSSSATAHSASPAALPVAPSVSAPTEAPLLAAPLESPQAASTETLLAAATEPPPLPAAAPPCTDLLLFYPPLPEEDPPPLPPEESPAVISQLPQTADAADQLPRPPEMLGTASRLSEALQMPDNAGSAMPPQRSLVEENRCQALLSWSAAVAKGAEKLRAAAAPQQPTRTGHTFKAVHREHSEIALRRPAPLGASCEEAAVDRKRKRTATSGAPEDGRKSKLHKLPSVAEDSGCTYVCLDNLGGVDQHQLRRGLVDASIEGVKRVEVVATELEEGTCHAGWGYAEFSSHRAAEEGLQKLRHLYVLTKQSPIPRPIISHWPRRWPAAENSRVPVLGHVPDLMVSPHFSQPNALEFDLGLHWRALRRRTAGVRQALRDNHMQQLHDVMLAGLQSSGADLKAGDPPRMEEHCWGKILWVKKLPSTCSIQLLTAGFEQWGGQVLEMLVDPITAAENGQALVKMNNDDQAARIVKDIEEMVLMMAASPRPLEASLVQHGRPTGSQGVYDKAMWHLLHTDDSQPQDDLDFVILNNSSLPEERAAEALRSLLDCQYSERCQLAEQVLDQERELAGSTEAHLDREFRKLIELVTFHSRVGTSKIRKLNVPPRYKHDVPPHSTKIFCATGQLDRRSSTQQRGGGRKCSARGNDHPHRGGCSRQLSHRG